MKTIIMKLTKTVVGSLPIHLRDGTKRSVTLIAADKVGLITGLGSKPLMRPINLECLRENFRIASEAMVVLQTASEKMVVEMLVADQPQRKVAHDKSSHFWGRKKCW